jgi:hypothetical protein
VNELINPQFHGDESDSSSNGPINPCTDYVDELAVISLDTTCTQNTYEQMLEEASKKQQDILRAINTNLFGVYCCVFNPRFDTSIYQQEDQDYHYPVVPDFEGKLLIEGLQNVLRYSGEDQWSSPSITLYWSRPNIFEIKENAKIVVHHGDQHVSLRSTNRRRQMGQFIELYEVHELVPYN